MAQHGSAAEHRAYPTQIEVLEPISLPHVRLPVALPYVVLLTAAVRCFILPITVRQQDDALARLGAFLTALYLLEIARLFPAGRV
jgi:formate hydrogenlyase subunit 4